MANYLIRAQVQGSRIDAVTKRAIEVFGTGCSVKKRDLTQSRADRLAQIEGDIADCVSEIESLRDEMQEWHDSIPENLQDGDKASEVQESIDALEEAITSIQDIDLTGISFPSMM